jgi:hypothetical protein
MSQPTADQKYFLKNVSVLNIYGLFCHYFLNNIKQQPFSQHLHCIRYCVLSRDDLKYTGECM